MRLIVTEIDIKPFNTLLPIVYCDDDWLPIVYLRTEMFHQQDINFQLTKAPIHGERGLQQTTGANQRQPLNADISDAEYTGYLEVNCLPLHPKSMAIEIDDDELKYMTDRCEDPDDPACVEDLIHQLAFEELMHMMPVNFFIQYITK